MTKKDIVRKVADQTGITQFYVKEILESILQVIQDSLNKGERITIQNFGTFYVKEFGERNAWNPKDGVPTKVSAKRVVKFKSALNKKA